MKAKSYRLQMQVNSNGWVLVKYSKSLDVIKKRLAEALVARVNTDSSWKFYRFRVLDPEGNVLIL